MSESARRAVREHLVAARAEQVAMLAELVRQPSDNPPGDCAPHAARTAALILEPLVQCAGGMAMYDAQYLREARALAYAAIRKIRWHGGHFRRDIGKTA